MAYYYKLDDDELEECINRNVYDKDLMFYSNSGANSHCEPSIRHDFSKYILVEFLDDFTPVKKLWELLGLVKNKAIVRKRLTVDPHRLKCRRAIIICVNAESAREIVNNLKGKKIIEREICAVVIEDLLADIKLFEKQIKKYGDLKTQEKLVYVSNLSKFRKPAVLVKFLNEKFSSFGTILSVLVSEGVDGYALGEAVIRFSYFSEAFAAELAYDECVLGKERLSVAMQHNILLCECDLRVRLRDRLNAYQNRVGVGRLFRPSVNSTKSSLGSECKIPSKNNIASNDKNIAGPSLTSHTSCVFSGINSHSHNSPLQRCNSSIELVRETPVNDGEENPLSNSTNICIVPETDSLLLRDNEKDSALQYSKEATTYDLLNACRNDELLLSDNSSSENSSRSWSSKLIGWVRSFVAKDDSLLIEKDISNQVHSQPSKQSPKEFFYSQRTRDTNWTGNEIESVPYLLLTRSISNLAEKNVSKLIPSNTGKTKKINQRSIRNVSDGNKSNAYSQNSLKLHGDVENCSPTKNRKISKFRADQHAANEDEENLRLDSSSNHKIKGKNSAVTEKRKKSKINSKRTSFNKSRSIMTRSKKKQSALSLSNEFNQDNTTSNNLRMAESTISTKHKLKKRKDKLLAGFSTSNHCSVGMSTKSDGATIASNDCSQQCSIQTEKDAILSQTATVSSSISSALLHADVNHLFHAYTTIDSTGNSNVTCQTIVNSTGVAVSSSEACFKEMQINSVAENCHLSQHSTLENTLKQKNLSVSAIHTRISSAVTTHRHDQHNSVFLSNERENSVASNSSISDSPIRTWLKEHLLCSVNNKVPTNEDNPEGIVFATMSKDVLISVGCSHMTCDVCYPGALNLIFGF